MPVSQRTPAFLGPVGFTGDFSPLTTGKISPSQNPLPKWTPVGLLVDNPRRESSGLQNEAICSRVETVAGNHAVLTQGLLSAEDNGGFGAAGPSVSQVIHSEIAKGLLL